MGAAMGVRRRLAVSADDVTYQEVEFLNCTVRRQKSAIDTAGLRGTRSHAAARARRGTNRTGGNVTVAPNPAELDQWLPRILGGAKAGNDVPLAEALPAFYLLEDRDAARWKYSGCKIDSATFSGAAGAALTLSMEVLALSGGGPLTAPFAAAAIDDSAGPYVFSEATLTVGGNPYQFFRCDLTVSNALEPRYVNSNDPTEINATDRLVTVSLDAPYGDAQDLYDLPESGVQVVLAFTNGAYSLVFTMPAVDFPAEDPVGQGRGEIRLPLVGTARRTAASAELAVANDSANP